MPTSMWHYTRALAEQLRVNGVPEPRVREIVAQVEAHVEATGEDPVAAFGQPVDYAVSWQRLSTRRWGWQILKGAAVALGAGAVLKVVVAGGSWGGGVPVTGDDVATVAVMVAIVAVMPWTVELWLSRRRAGRLGESSSPTDWPYRLAGGYALILTLAFGTRLLFESATQTVLTLPRWLLLAGGLAGVAMSLFDTRVPGNATQPRPPWAGRETWLARVRRVLG